MLRLRFVKVLGLGSLTFRDGFWVLGFGVRSSGFVVLTFFGVSVLGGLVFGDFVWCFGVLCFRVWGLGFWCLVL